MQKYKFYLYFYNDSNLGDDLFLDTLVRRYPNFDFYIYADKNSPPLNWSLKLHNNLHYADICFSNKTYKSEISKYDGVILIGGSVFQDLSYSLYRGYIGRYLIFKKIIKAGKKIFVIGSNLGPFKTLFGKLIFKVTLKHVSHICVRDSYSFNLLNEWEIKNRDLAPDIIFGYDFHPKFKPGNNKDILGISILNTKLNPEVRNLYIEKMAGLTNMYLKESPNKMVRLFGFDGGNENDGEIIDEVLKLLNFPERAIKVEYNNNITINEYLNLFIECSYILANRFHSVILAAKFGIPFFPIIYSEKTSNALNDIGYFSTSVQYKKIDSLNLNTMHDLIRVSEKNYAIKDTICSQSIKHFIGLDHLI